LGVVYYTGEVVAIYGEDVYERKLTTACDD
jgi:hypothetical protein